MEVNPEGLKQLIARPVTRYSQHPDDNTFSIAAMAAGLVGSSILDWNPMDSVDMSFCRVKLSVRIPSVWIR